VAVVVAVQSTHYKGGCPYPDHHLAKSSNQVLDFNVDNPIYGPQLPDPFPWDAPNRFLSTGILPGKLPVLHKVDVEYSAEARTGFPFYLERIS
jgi:hypothetical protein